MPAEGTTGRFAVAGTRRLRSLGLEGKRIFARLDGARLILAGEESGEVALPLAEIDRVRVGRDDAKHGPFYEARLWRDGDARPLVLHVSKYQLDGYAGFVRALSAAVAASRGLDRVERGLSLFGALLPPLLMLPVFLGAAAVSLAILGDQPWWGRLLVPFVPALIFGLLLWRCLAVHLPQPVRDLKELDRHLP